MQAQQQAAPRPNCFKSRTRQTKSAAQLWLLAAKPTQQPRRVRTHARPPRLVVAQVRHRAVVQQLVPPRLERALRVLPPRLERPRLRVRRLCRLRWWDWRLRLDWQVWLWLRFECRCSCKSEEECRLEGISKGPGVTECNMSLKHNNR